MKPKIKSKCSVCHLYLKSHKNIKKAKKVKKKINIFVFVLNLICKTRKVSLKTIRTLTLIDTYK